ncbi:Similar to hypothetical protein THITE_2145780 [Thielavia terrestris NRRL 8126]; acc. no. XP_003655037 [Pyronema omphalodes CBS 100304]|uniref:Uncharacterized protein n=1 Tax=Pyronema omphalodes (strain CBS 100304) TaxID=1076935 RepID=U4LIU4_PYROM|nr:Similar to hypothetical protein THITE_2145780 [Thielavia terrestris NRRL 8126]; acc. no. XP_003655037 [Pyronema omphalodes CBS 100304]
MDNSKTEREKTEHTLSDTVITNDHNDFATSSHTDKELDQDKHTSLSGGDDISLSTYTNNNDFGFKIYCEEGLETLQQRYIRIHGLCFLLRGTRSSGIKFVDASRCDRCERKMPLKADPENQPAKPKLDPKLECLGCQVGQYMMVRLPPNCQVQWKDHDKFKDPPNQRKYHAREGTIERIMRNICTWREPETNQHGPWISPHDSSVSASYSITKSFIALFQLYSIIDFLAKSYEKGNNGFKNSHSSYQLTMIPYGLMSLLNILCGILTPSYPAVYMVKNSVMEEAMRRGGVFDGIFGELVEKDIDTTKMTIFEHQKQPRETQNTATSVIFTAAGAIAACKNRVSNCR